MPDKKLEQTVVVDIDQLSFCYAKSGENVLDIAKWQVAQGEKVFLYGPSGSGKSTLLNLLSGTLVPSSGQIHLLGQAFSALSPRRRDKFRAQHIGVVFQQFNLIPYLTVRQNIELACYFAGNNSGQAEQQIQQLFQQLQLNSALLLRPVSDLSVGQQQRVAIARALVNQPELLIVDEPTSALDSDARDGFMSLLMTSCDAHKTTLVFVSHDRALARYFTKSQSILELQGQKESV
ncbi:MAG: ABC transporter ATP-binding protein [Aestuariibacter sp.]